MPRTNALLDCVITPVFRKLFIFPAVKCTVTIDILSSSNLGTRPTYVKLLCIGYSENDTYSIDSVSLLETPFLSLHQAIFSNANFKQIPSMVEYAFLYLNEEELKQALCISKHKLFSSIWCTDIMSFLLLGIVNNSTFLMIKSAPENLKKYQVKVQKYKNAFVINLVSS